MTKKQNITKNLALALAGLLIVVMVVSVVNLFLYVFGNLGIKETVEAVAVEGTVESIDLDLDATTLTVCTGSTFKVETNNENLVVKNDGGVLKIRDTYRSLFFKVNKNSHLILTIPADMIFKSVEINTGAGVVEIDALLADTVDFEFGAGEVQIGSLYITEETKIEGGAGRIEIGGGLIADLDLDMGVGALVLRSKLWGVSEINCGVGTSEITLIGEEEIYSVEISKGIGAVTVGETEMKNGETYGNGKNKLRISGGVGEIHVAFDEG